ncbi:MAG: Jag N-terminal domain-containing protein [Clostridia bacterium]|nr:Jag N-terminal domain-containing protein [Clostridia bacterium]
MEEQIFTAKTVDEAIELGLTTLGITLDEAEITVLEEGKKKLFGSVKAKVQIKKKGSDARRAADFIDGLLEILGIQAVSEITDEDENIRIEIKTPSSSKVIGKRGDVLDAIQCIAGAVANTGRDEYKKVVVDCENYRTQREETLKKLADKLAKKAIETGRKVVLEPMNPYERRIIHSALANYENVKTVSEGREPARYIAVIPDGAKPYDKGIKFGERKPFGNRDKGGRPERKFDRRGGRDGNRERRPSSGGRPSRGKKEIVFGAFLGNSGNKSEE